MKRDGFSAVLKQRVDEYFRVSKRSKHLNTEMLLKVAFYILGFIGLYAVSLTVYSKPFLYLFTMAVLGSFIPGIGFNVAHDGAHGAMSGKRWVNRLAAHAFELIGACSYTWKIRHNVLHHSYTNILGADGDLESMPLLRFCIRPGRKAIHRFQHFYALFLYCFVTLVWVFTKDYKHLFQEQTIAGVPRRPPKRVWVSLFISKGLHYFFFLVVPIFILKMPWLLALSGFLIMHAVAGFFLALVFQTGHCVEGTIYANASEYDLRIPDEWAAFQLKTSCNFRGGWLAAWCCGGLHFQIEHHLFPQICHVHYPAIAPIVRQTATEFGLPYLEKKNFWVAVVSHLRTLRYLGRTD